MPLKHLLILLFIAIAHGSAFPFTKLVLIGICWIEIKSIDENFNILFGYSFMNKVLEGLKSINQIKRHKDEWIKKKMECSYSKILAKS